MTGDNAFERGSVTRRQALASGGMLLSVSALLAACGDDGTTGSKTAGNNTASATGAGEGLAITKLSELVPFTFSDDVGAKPNLPKRMSFGQIDAAELHLHMAEMVEKACRERGVDFVEANADSKVATQVQQTLSFIQRGTAALQLQPLAPNTLNKVAGQAIQKGIAVFNVIDGPSTCQQMADQYEVGKAHGEAAVDWIRKNLGGKATVVYFNGNTLAAALIPRTNGALAALRAEPGIKVINIGMGANDWTPQGGYKKTSTLLQANRDVDVILGADTVIVGVEKAVKAVGNTSVKYIAGVDGEATVLDAILKGGLIKATFGFSQGLAAYATGQFAADWIEGKTIPQAIRYVPFKMDTPEAIAKFKALNADPASKWKSSPEVVGFHGSISYATRHKWIRGVLSGGAEG